MPRYVSVCLLFSSYCCWSAAIAVAVVVDVVFVIIVINVIHCSHYLLVAVLCWLVILFMR